MSLENVIIKEAESMLVGTVKVKNISFQKEVIVRSTWDNWKTQQDTICTFTPVSHLKFIRSLSWVHMGTYCYNEFLFTHIQSVIKINNLKLICNELFAQICGGGGSYVIYDTFSFKLTLPPSSVVLEFCVCFRVDGTEYWDSNEVRWTKFAHFSFRFHHFGSQYIGR